MIGSTLQSGLVDAQNAYFIGVQKKPVILTADPFDPIMSAILAKNLPVEQQCLIKQVRGLYEQGLTTARQGELKTSRKIFQEAEAFLATEAIEREALLFSRSLYEAAVAYLDYRNAEFEWAIQRLNTALALDLTLAETPGYELIHVHRIRLLLNMLRIQMKRSVAEVMDTGVLIMDFLESKGELQSSYSLQRSQVSVFPDVLKELLFAEAVGDLSTLLAGIDSVEVNKHVARFASHIDLPQADACSLSPQAHAWLSAKQALADGQTEKFLDLACSILAQGRTSLPQLWYATVIDLLCLCQSLDLPEARVMKKEILAAAPSWPWKHFSVAWQKLLQLPLEKPTPANPPGRNHLVEYGSTERVSVVNASET